MSASEPGLRVEPRCENVGGTDEVVAWEVWNGDEWLDTFDNEGDAIEHLVSTRKRFGLDAS
jgi:hypothetical protein